jgi:uncharacterized membrane protein YcfT
VDDHLVRSQAPDIAASAGAGEVARLYLLSLIDPLRTLWFIYLLPIFLVTVKRARRVPVAVIAAFLFERPAQSWLVCKRVALQPAE